MLDVCFRHRSSLLLLLAFPVVFWALDARGGGSAGASTLGVLAVGGGVALRLCAVRRIGRGARVHRAHASGGLVCSGPYAWTRNPLYLAAALMLCGFALLAGGGAWAAALVPATPLVYTPVVLAEERALRRILGAPYQRYLESVPRWIGFPAPSRRAPADDLVPWREVLRRERWLVPGAVLGGVATRAIASRPVGVGAAALAGVWLAAALWNSVHIERKWRQRRRRRGFPAPEDGETGGLSSPSEGPRLDPGDRGPGVA